MRDTKIIIDSKERALQWRKPEGYIAIGSLRGYRYALREMMNDERLSVFQPRDALDARDPQIYKHSKEQQHDACSANESHVGMTEE